LNKTAVLVTHDLNEAAAMSDRVVVLGRNPGHIRAVYNVPAQIRNALPTAARKLPEFQSMFDLIWGALEDSRAKGDAGDE
jgi:NitT/TauT family transport system ATP-binding protein